jgi:hypothetical protein
LPENHKCLNPFLPRLWSRHVKSALLHVISLARLACVHTWAWAAGSIDTRTRLAAQLQQARAENTLLREELRIKDARMAQIAAHRRPHYPPTERMWPLLSTYRKRRQSAAPGHKYFSRPAASSRRRSSRRVL